MVAVRVFIPTVFIKTVLAGASEPGGQFVCTWTRIKPAIYPSAVRSRTCSGHGTWQRRGRQAPTATATRSTSRCAAARPPQRGSRCRLPQLARPSAHCRAFCMRSAGLVPSCNRRLTVFQALCFTFLCACTRSWAAACMWTTRRTTSACRASTHARPRAGSQAPWAPVRFRNTQTKPEEIQKRSTSKDVLGRAWARATWRAGLSSA